MNVLRSTLACLLLTFAPSALAVPRYALVDLGTLGGVSLSPTCISKSGVIAGVASDGRAFSYSPAMGVTSVGAPAGYSRIQPARVNDAGEFIGYLYNGNYSGSRAFVYKPGGGIAELELGSGWQNCITDINNSGIAVGYLTTASQDVHAYSASTNGAMTDLGAVHRSADWLNLSINDSGQMLGSYYRDVENSDWWTLTSEVRVYANGQASDLNSLNEVTSCTQEYGRRILEAYDINNLGQVVGMSGLYYAEWGDPGVMMGCIGGDARVNSYDCVRAFLYTPGSAPVDLGVLPCYESYSNALAVNDLGQVVGCSVSENCATGDSQAAFLYSDGRMYDLNTLVDGPAEGWTLTGASEINNNGQIIADGYQRRGQEWVHQTFLLNPVPEPSSLAVLFSGLLAVAFVASRRRRCR